LFFNSILQTIIAIHEEVLFNKFLLPLKIVIITLTLL